MTMKRDRGKLLTPAGYQKLNDAISNWKENWESEYQKKPTDLELSVHADLSQATISRIRKGAPAQVATLKKIFIAFDLELEDSDYCSVPNDIAPPAPKYMVLKWEQIVVDESTIDIEPPSIRLCIDELDEEQQKAFDDFIEKLTGKSSQNVFKNVGIWKSAPSKGSGADRSLVYRDSEQSYDYAKLIELEGNQAVILTMQILSEEQVKFMVLPTEEAEYLPIDLQLLLLNEQEKIVEAQKICEEIPSLALEVSGELGDRFSLSIQLRNFTFTEGFVFQEIK